MVMDIKSTDRYIRLVTKYIRLEQNRYYPIVLYVSRYENDIDENVIRFFEDNGCIVIGESAYKNCVRKVDVYFRQSELLRFSDIVYFARTFDDDGLIQLNKKAEAAEKLIIHHDGTSIIPNKYFEK